MAIGVYFALNGMTADKYAECLKQLRKAGVGSPTGRAYHASFGPKDKLMVFDVWSSQSAFDKFGRTLMPILQGLGIEPGQPSLMPIHKVIVPAAKSPRPASRPAAKRTRVGSKKR
jgi:hypothetical protein